MAFDRIARRLKIKKRVRKTVHGTPDRPRLSVYRSNDQIYAQLIDDYAGKTLLSVASTSGELRGAELKNGGNIAAARRRLAPPGSGPVRAIGTNEPVAAPVRRPADGLAERGRRDNCFQRISPDTRRTAARRTHGDPRPSPTAEECP